MNFIDFMAILPVFLTMILEGLEDMRVTFVKLSQMLVKCFKDYWESWKSYPVSSCDENHESLQTSSPFRRAPVPGLHAAAGDIISQSG